MSTELTTLETLTPAVVFAPGKVEDLISRIEAEQRAIKSDISTEKGRKEIASRARKIASSKTALDAMGKALTDEHRLAADKVHAERRVIIARFDALRDEVRKPLTDYENAEKDRISLFESMLEGISDSREAYASDDIEGLKSRLEWLKNYPEHDWQEFAQRAADTIELEIARTSNALQAAQRREFDRVESARLQAEQDERDRLEGIRIQHDREQRIAAEATRRAQEEAERARLQAELKAQRDRQESARLLEEAKQKAESDRLAAELRIKEAEAKADRDRLAAEAKAERDRSQAIEAERNRAADVEEAKQKAEQERAADKKHRASVNQTALADLLERLPIDETTARAIITHVARGEIHGMKMEY